MPCFSWREHDPAEDNNQFTKNTLLSCHPRPDGILFTMHSNMVDKRGNKFNHSQSCFFASFEQIMGITNFLLIYLKEINDAKNKHELP
jgi:hypothetical protein